MKANIKKILTASLITGLFVMSYSAHAASPYIEGQLGMANVDNVDTNTYNGSVDGITVIGLQAKLDYDNSATFGAEFGFKDVLIPNLRIGASIQNLKFDLDSAEINGAITDGSTTITGPVTVSSSDLSSVGLRFNNRVNLYMINTYYDFKTSTNLTPFVGFGVGLADIRNAKDKEFAYTFSAGAKYSVNSNMYVGAKATYTNVSGPKDDLGIKFQDIDVYSANVSIGYEF